MVIASVNNRFLAKSLKGVLEMWRRASSFQACSRKWACSRKLFLQMTAIGEETGHLADMLLSAAGSLENDAKGLSGACWPCWNRY